MAAKSQLCAATPEVEPKPRLFLLDDDPVFCQWMAKAAKRLSISLAVCSKLEDFGTKRDHREFDVALIDYFLEGLTGSEVACLLEERPIFLVSHSERSELSPTGWPESVKGFLPKSLGADAILAEVCRWQQSQKWDDDMGRGGQ